MSSPARRPSDMRLGPKLAARLIVFFVAWAAVVGGFYVWRGMRGGSKADLGMRLQQISDPKVMQDATIEMAARMKQHEVEAQRWYPTLLKMAKSSSVELRGTAAWIMANDTTRDDFHQALLTLSRDPSPSVRANAAVSLVKFSDPAGRETVLKMLQSPGSSSDDQWEALRALRVIGQREDLVITDRFADSSDPRVREAAREAAQGIKDRI